MIPPLYSITVDTFDIEKLLEDGKIHVYFTFAEHNTTRMIINESTFRARFTLKNFTELTHREICKISSPGDSREKVANDIRAFAKKYNLESQIGSVPEQIEAGKGKDTRTSDNLFED